MAGTRGRADSSINFLTCAYFSGAKRPFEMRTTAFSIGSPFPYFRCSAFPNFGLPLALVLLLEERASALPAYQKSCDLTRATEFTKRTHLSLQLPSIE